MTDHAVLPLPQEKQPTLVKCKVSRIGKTNEALRSREHLTETEVEALMKSARQNRHGHRDATMILMAYRHASVAGRGPAGAAPP